MAGREAGGPGHRVRVLEQLAELARRLHRPEGRERLVGRHAPELEDPLEVLPRQAGAGADELPDEHLLRRFGVAQLERGQEARDRRVPGQLALGDEAREQQRGERLGVGRDHEERVAVDLRRLAELAHAVAPGEDELSVLDDPERDSRNAELLLARLDETAELGEAGRVESVRLLSGERLARVALRLESVEDQRDLRSPLFADRLRHVVDHDRPAAAGVRRQRQHVALLVRRRLVVVGALLRPAVAVGPVAGDLERPLRVRLVRGPGRRDRRVGVLPVDVDEGDARVPLGGFDDRHGPSHGDRPADGSDEGVAADGGLRRVDGEGRTGRCQRCGGGRGLREGRSGREQEQTGDRFHENDDIAGRRPQVLPGQRRQIGIRASIRRRCPSRYWRIT